MAQEWFYSKNGDQQGPFTSQQLKQLAASGDIQPTDLVWTEGQDEWQPAQSIKGLFSEKQLDEQGPPTLPTPAAPSTVSETLDSVRKRFMPSILNASFARVVQKIAWSICGVVIVLGGFLFLAMVSQADTAIQEAAAGAFFSTVFIAAYVLARAIEKFTNL